MQNRYVGDVGDFAKYALLRSISLPNDLRLGLVWCLFKDEVHNSDGRHTGYLKRGELRSLDPTLFDLLARLVISRKRSVREVANAAILGTDTVYFPLPLSAPKLVGRDARLAHRAKWLSKALSFTAGCDVVFFDPDNGLETRSVPIHAPKAGKYIFWDELKSFWDRGQSLVVYHHLNRTSPVAHQTDILRQRFVAHFPTAHAVKSVLFRQGSCRHFWVVSQKAHANMLTPRVEKMLCSGWSGYFEIG